MPATDFTVHLRDLVDPLTAALPRTSWRRMFGCDAAFVDAKIYALIWKEGRVGVKLPDAAKYSELLAQEGAAPWAPGGMKMSGWVLVPEQFHDEGDALAEWLREAHAEVDASEGKPKKPAARKAAAAPAKKAAPKAPAAKKTSKKASTAAKTSAARAKR